MISLRRMADDVDTAVPAAESMEWLLGIGLDAVATLSGTVGKQLLRFAATSGNVWMYPLGMFFTGVIDPVFDAGAYAFAAASIVTACAGLVIVWNVILAPFTLGEQLTRSRAAGAALIVIGTAGTGVFGDHRTVDRSLEEYLDLICRRDALCYYALLVLALACCALGARSSLHRSFCLSAFAGLLAGNTFTTKATVELLQCVFTSASASCADNPFATPWPYLMLLGTLVSSGGSLLILAFALQDSEALMAITVFEGCMIISGAISGNLVLMELWGISWHQFSFYCASVILILLGLAVLLNGERPPSKAPQLL